MELLPRLDAAEVRRLDRAHVMHSWSAQDLIDPPGVVAARGSRFTDHTGREYLDFSSQLVNVNLGHQHPDLVAAIAEAAGRMTTMAPSFAVETRSQAAAMIADRAPGDLDAVFFTNGGADANEHAIRMARLHTGRHKVLAAYRSYHGGTAGAMALTGEPRRWGSEPSLPGIVHHWGPYPYRSPFHSDSPEQECERALAHLREVVEVEGPQHVAAIVLETVVGTNGVLVPPDGYLAGVRTLCDEHGIVMIADEVMAGFGRVGEWFAVDRWGITPDLITFAKGVNSGYVPLGGVVVSAAIRETFGRRPYPGGLTYQGHPLACASAVASMRIFERDGVVEHARALGEDVIGPGLREIAQRHPSVGEVRGLGVMWAVELVRDRETREPLVPFNASGDAASPMSEVAAACKAAGLWPMIAGNRVHVVPPCTTTADEVREGLAILDEALAVADARTA
ncbi:aspartate aminotransferase family protein [Janibacter indicus]|uniref:Aspartate aminotransferase family protein n=1 Tax=Janibacter indicus TaxID=857417 RepID=A0A7L9J096_9MICO|nr:MULTISPECIES: aspartate aminotransferase family protein [Janibacter]QNF94046.1 aspartate aminotransferase family protein [Janibacter sp. YB324]QOK22652.1 aspartate aminotransferase family protein [Janibacter indicus]